MEEGAVGIELTSFTKKDMTVGEPERQERAQAEGSPDSLGDKVAEPTADTEMGQEQSEQVSGLNLNQVHFVNQTVS